MIPLTEPFVQILDPATGTGTFLVEAIEVIYTTMRSRWQKQGHMELEFPKLWNDYVPKHLLPRLYGFETNDGSVCDRSYEDRPQACMRRDIVLVLTNARVCTSPILSNRRATTRNSDNLKNGPLRLPMKHRP